MRETIAAIAIFAGLQLVNVILNTIKTLIMAKTDNPHASAVINAVTFGFYIAVVQQIGNLPLIYTIPVTMATNVIGVYVSYEIMKKFKKDNLWKIEIYLGNSIDLYEQLQGTGVPMAETAPQIVTMYAYTQNDSEKIKKVVNHSKIAKYNITEITKKF